MNKFIVKFLFVGLASMLLWSCEKDETRAVAKAGTGLTLTASQTALVLNGAAPSDTVQTFSWTPADFGFDAGVTYTLQIAKAGTDFATPKDVILSAKRGIKYTNADLNQIALVSLGLPTGSAGAVEARVKAEASAKLAPVYSNIVSFTLTPYLVIINYPSLWVPGDHQGWTPATADKLSSVLDNGNYEGFVNISGGNLKFKFTSNPDWDHTNYGVVTSMVDGNKVSGTISSSGGDISVPGVGYYRMKVNTTALTFEAVKTAWGLIGDAIPVTGWNSDQDLTYDAASKTWSITIDLDGGKAIKFRANDAWDINFGDDGADTSLEYNGANISIAESGNYTITLDLSTPGYFKYKVVKN